MRKLIYLILFAVLISINACTDSETPELPQVKSMYTNIISPEEAVAIANAVGNANPNKARSNIRSASVSDVKVLGNPASRSGKNDTLIYAVDYADEQGFALIAATPVEEPVLAVIDNGSYDEEEFSKVPGFESFMDAARGYAASTYGHEITITPVEPAKDVKIDTLTHRRVLPKLGIMTWGQDGAEGSLCPNYISGCIPTAMAMIITYFKPTQKIYYTFEGARILGEFPDWTAMAEHTGINCTTCSPTTHSSISHLCREVGNIGYSTYNNGITLTSSSYVPRIIDKFLPGYQYSNITSYSSPLVRDALDKGLVLMLGNNSDHKYTPHAWVAEGYDYYKLQKTITYHLGEAPWLKEEVTTKIVDVVYFNTGKDGKANGYFSGSVFKFWDGKKLLGEYDDNYFISIYK